MTKTVVIAFWLLAAPILGYGMLYAIGETVEHFAGNDGSEP